MQGLDKRLSALEQASPTGEKVNTIILVPLLKDGDAVLETIRDNHGNAWSRRLDESQEAFKNRAVSETTREGNRIVMMIAE